MHLTVNNVNDAFYNLVKWIDDGSIKTERRASRVGEVIQITEPVIITYENPRERVLLNVARDANPFFHVFESLWMLAGRNDVAPLKYYASKIDFASDDGQTFNGAYGYRWRHPKHLDFSNSPSPGDVPYGNADQLKVIIEHFKKNPDSRRVVLQMWNVEDDLLKIDTSKDVCCNTSVMFSVRRGDCPNCNDGLVSNPQNGPEDAPSSHQCPMCRGFSKGTPRWLDMTVTNRSNDLIWGALGANVVHFSFLQEYLACAIGLEVGLYHQFTNNLHVYTETNSGFHPEKWTAEGYRNYPEGSNQIPLVQDVETFDQEVASFISCNYYSESIIKHLGDTTLNGDNWQEPWLDKVAQPMCNAFHCYKRKDWESALVWANQVRDAAWRTVAVEWIQRRLDKKVNA